MAQLLLLVAVAGWMAPIAATDGPQLEVIIPEAAVTVGDRIPVRLVARGGEGLLWGDLTVEVPAGGPWEVVAGPRAVTGARPPAWELTLAPMVVGEQRLPELAATVRQDARSEPHPVKPGTLPTVTIASVLPPDQEVDPAPLRDPVGVHGFPWEYVLPASVTMIPLLALSVWWLRHRRQADGDRPWHAQPPLARLEARLLELAGRVGRDPAATICDPLAAVTRDYLELRTGEPAREMTSAELRRLARTSPWPDSVHRGLDKVLTVADQVRFGRRPAADDELRAAIEAALGAGRELDGFLAEREPPREVAS